MMATDNPIEWTGRRVGVLSEVGDPPIDEEFFGRIAAVDPFHFEDHHITIQFEMQHGELFHLSIPSFLASLRDRSIRWVRDKAGR